MKRILFILLLLLISTSPAQAQDPITEIMNRMTVEDKVGQLFLVPFVGPTAHEGSDIWQLLTEYKVGGVILLAANSNFNNDPSAPRQIAELTNSLKTIAYQTNGLPLFVAIDQEGDGYPYTRITGGVTPLPSQMSIGATWETANAEAIGQIVGEELSVMGINVLLGPGLDVLNDPRSSGRGDIGLRVFGGDPYWVGQMGRAYIRGVHRGSRNRVMTVAKHFPGHGGSDRLPDNEVATVDKSLHELRRIELPPFFHVTAAGPDDPLGRTDALMSSHIRYRGFQGDIRQFTAPISFDAEGMDTLKQLPEIAAWREDGGLIISDALGVPAVRKHFDPSLQSFPHRRIAKDAFLAGNDILSLVQFDLKSIWSDQFANIKDTIYFFQTEYRANPAFAKQVDATVARILRTKLALYPDLTLETLTVDPYFALEISGKSRPVISEIAQESLTLLYPTAEELRQRIPAPPAPDDTLLIITDSRLARQCYTDNCRPEELFLPRAALEETILRFYGPGGTGQIEPDRISSITFAELKQALSGAIFPPAEATEPTDEWPAHPEIQVSAEEVGHRIQAANWLIFAILDLNLSRFEHSDALKLFLAQERGTLRNKTTIVLAFNAPYYLDTTEVTKLTAYYGLYSKTQPHIEIGARAIFGETDFPGASPVSVESIGYRLEEVLSPAPDQQIPLEILSALPADQIAPVSVEIQAGPIVDHNGHIVPDNTPVEIKAMIGQRAIAAETVPTETGLAQTSLKLTEPGQIELMAIAGQNAASAPISLSVIAPPSPTPAQTFTPIPLPPTESPTSPPPSPTPSPTATHQPTVEPLPPATPPASPSSPDLTGLDLFSALAATLLAGMVGLWQQGPRPSFSRRLRLGLWILVMGLLAYLFYGWLRPDQWLFAAPTVAVSRLVLAGLAFLAGLAAIGIYNSKL